MSKKLLVSTLALILIQISTSLPIQALSGNDYYLIVDPNSPPTTRNYYLAIFVTPRLKAIVSKRQLEREAKRQKRYPELIQSMFSPLTPSATGNEEVALIVVPGSKKNKSKCKSYFGPDHTCYPSTPPPFAPNPKRASYRTTPFGAGVAEISLIDKKNNVLCEPKNSTSFFPNNREQKDFSRDVAQYLDIDFRNQKFAIDQEQIAVANYYPKECFEIIEDPKVLVETKFDPHNPSFEFEIDKSLFDKIKKDLNIKKPFKLF